MAMEEEEEEEVLIVVLDYVFLHLEIGEVFLFPHIFLRLSSTQHTAWEPLRRKPLSIGLFPLGIIFTMMVLPMILIQGSRNFPDYYYSRLFEVPDERGKSRASLHLLTLDTVMLCGLPKGGGDGGGQPIGACDLQSSKSQLQWLEEQLAHSNATYLLVAGHYPVWSVAEHGPTKCLLSLLRPLLIRYQVTAYLSGHDHCLQYLQEPGLSVGYVISGAGTFMNPSLEHVADVPPGSLRFHFSDIEGLGGFVYATATVQNLTFFYIDGRGKSLFSVTLPPRRPNLK
uniref:tartrate-resistant acid phosphatase type 5 isoform X2 n=1 Tax=Myxine glutinosa TaxID=7769 RepID=UPI00358EB3FD